MRHVLLIGLLSIAALSVQAQDAPAAPPAPRPAPASPEQMRQAMAAGFNAMGPAMAQMQDAMLESSLKAAERPETAARIAAFKKNLFDALLKQGFSEQQAMSITLNTQIPSIGK